MDIKKGEIYLINLDPVIDSEQGKTRPCLIIQNNIGNKYSQNTIIASITSKIDKEYPFLVKIDKGVANLPKDSFVQLDQIRTISVKRIIKKIGSLPKDIMLKINVALKNSLDL
ncbi:MAG: type II toxin-antitoxin system PemK/MazF family toxin [Candidatus ainarchaeum sp.]|nr:type II toxin-antitoxin system PemK/MazF family toxin [Candidatus ainarchaeum sp.]